MSTTLVAGLEQVHKDDIHAVDVDPDWTICYPSMVWTLVNCTDSERSGDDPSEEPDWYGY